MRVLGIDPGYAIVGYGVVDSVSNKYTAAGCGAITTPAGMDFDERLERIFDGMCDIIKKYHPEQIAIEKLFFNTNNKTVIEVAQARGVILLAAKKWKIPAFEYTPLQVKQAITGYGRAEKSQMIEMTRVLLHLESAPKPDDTADALAMAICHAQTAGSLLRKIKL